MFSHATWKSNSRAIAKEEHMRLPDWRNASRSFVLVYLLMICSLQFSPLGVQCPKPWAVATDGPSRTRSNCGPTRRNSSQSRELGRQCDLSCRSGAGGGHGSHLLFPRTRCRAMGGNSGRIAGDLRPHSPDRVLDSERYGGRAVRTLTAECSGNDAAPNHRRSVDTAIRHGSSGCHLHDGAGWNRIAAGRRRELPGGRQVPEMGAVVGNSA